MTRSLASRGRQKSPTHKLRETAPRRNRTPSIRTGPSRSATRFRGAETTRVSATVEEGVVSGTSRPAKSAQSVVMYHIKLCINRNWRSPHVFGLQVIHAASTLYVRAKVVRLLRRIPTAELAALASFACGCQLGRYDSRQACRGEQ